MSKLEIQTKTVETIQSITLRCNSGCPDCLRVTETDDGILRVVIGTSDVLARKDNAIGFAEALLKMARAL